MFNSINQLSYSNSIQKPVFKESFLVSKPSIEVNNIGNDSLEALASYNVAQLNIDKKTKNNILKPFPVPNNINEIKGEKIYNSEGKLVKIVDEDENYITEYRFNDNIKYNMIKTDKNTNIVYQQISDGNCIYLDKMLPNGEVFSTTYENNIPVQVDEYFYSRNVDQTVTYSPKNNEFSLSQHFKTKDGTVSRFLDYDKEGKCTSAFESTDKVHKEVNIIDGKPYAISKNSSEVIENNIDVSAKIDLTNLRPNDYCDLDIDKIYNLEGTKKYYSNGNLEKIITDDKKTYSFNLSGELTEIKTDNYKIQFDTKEDTICSRYEPNDSQRIERKLDNGGIIVTQYSQDENSVIASVFYENPSQNENKSAVYKDGKLISYNNYVDNFSVNFDMDGFITSIEEGTA